MPEAESRRGPASGQSYPERAGDGANAEPRSNEPRYGVRLSAAERDELRRKQGLDPVVRGQDSGGVQGVGGRRFPRRSGTHVSPSGPVTDGGGVDSNPYAPAGSSDSGSASARGGAVPNQDGPRTDGASALPLPSRKGPWWVIALSAVLMVVVPVGVFVYATLSLMSPHPEGSSAGGLQQVSVGESFPVQAGEKVWAMVQGVDDSAACVLNSATAGSARGVSGKLIGAQMQQAFVSFPRVDFTEASISCGDAKPSALFVGTGDIEEWSFRTVQVLQVALLIGFACLVSLIVGIVWLVRVRRRRERMMASC